MQTKITLEPSKKEFKPITLNIQLTIEGTGEWNAFTSVIKNSSSMLVPMVVEKFLRDVCQEVHNSYKP